MSRASQCCFAFNAPFSVAGTASPLDLLRDAARLLRCAEGALLAQEFDSPALDAVAQLLAQACGLLDVALAVQESGSVVLTSPSDVYCLSAAYVVAAGCTVQDLCADAHALVLSASGVLTCEERTKDAEWAVVHLVGQGAHVLGALVGGQQRVEVHAPAPAISVTIPQNVADYWERQGNAVARRDQRKRGA